MRSRVGKEIITNIRQAALWSVLSLFLISCSERNLKIGFLNPFNGNNPSSHFKVENANSSGQIDADGETLPLKISCGTDVSEIEILNQKNQEWQNVNIVQTAVQMQCGDSATSLGLKVEDVLAAAMPVENEALVEFTLRWKVLKASTQEVESHQQNFTLVFKAPAFSVPASAMINYDLSLQGYQQIQGTCSADGGLVEIHVNAQVYNSPCSASSFVFDLPISMFAEGANSITVIQSDKLGRAYSRKMHEILVDRTHPVLTLEDTSGGITLNLASPSPFPISGTCSESLMSVRAYVMGILAGEGLCSAVNTFSFAIPLTMEGAFGVAVRQSDLAGNEGQSTTITLIRDVTAPDFNVIGIKGTGQSTTSAILSALFPWVSLGSTPYGDIINYSVQIKDETGTTTLCSKDGGGQSLEFSGCRLPQDSNFKIYATATDAAGNSVAAGNSPFSFKTQYPVPRLVSIETNTALNSFLGQSNIVLFADFDRDVSVTGAPTLAMNTGEVAHFISVDGSNSKRLIFEYSIGPNVYAAPLEVDAFSVNGASVVSLNNSDIAADFTVPSLGGDGSLGSKKIVVHTVSLNFTLGQANVILTKSPLISYIPPNFAGSQVKFEIFRKSDNLLVKTSTAWDPGFSLDLGQDLGLDKEYRVVSTVLDVQGRAGPPMTNEFRSYSCPVNFVYLANNGAPFCMAKYEAKTTSNPQFVPTGIPVALTRTAAVTACSTLGAGYTLTTNAEWMTIANEIYSIGTNWTLGQVDYNGGRIHRGNIFFGNAVEAKDADRCWPTPLSSCEAQGLRRTHNLKYDQLIWDISGNAAEVMADIDVADYGVAGYVQVPLITTNLPAAAIYAPAQVCTGASASNLYCGLGQVYFPSGYDTIWRGGNAVDDSYAGIFAARRVTDGGGALTNGGFRCAYRRP